MLLLPSLDDPITFIYNKEDLHANKLNLFVSLTLNVVKARASLYLGPTAPMSFARNVTWYIV